MLLSLCAIARAAKDAIIATIAVVVVVVVVDVVDDDDDDDDDAAVSIVVSSSAQGLMPLCAIAYGAHKRALTGAARPRPGPGRRA